MITLDFLNEYEKKCKKIKSNLKGLEKIMKIDN